MDNHDRFTEAMPTLVYRIIIEKDEDGRFVVSCPDLQGVATDGATKEEAEKNAVEAVQAMLDELHIEKDFILTISEVPSG